MWANAVATGFGARELAKHLGLDAELAQLCGLLHNVGEVVLLSEIDGARVAERKKPEFRAGFEEMRGSAATLGRVVLLAWKLAHQHGYTYPRRDHRPDAAALIHTLGLSKDVVRHVYKTCASWHPGARAVAA